MTGTIVHDCAYFSLFQFIALLDKIIVWNLGIVKL